MGILDADAPIFNVRALDKDEGELTLSAFSTLEAAQEKWMMPAFGR